MYSADTVGSDSFFKRFSHSRRFEFAARLMTAPPGSRLLDYGTGDGKMLSLLRAAQPDCEVWGFEPVGGMLEELSERFRAEGIANMVHIVADPAALEGIGFDRICCLEVLEHLPGPILVEALNRMRDLLTPGARLVVSVPLETGLSSIAKTAIRCLQKKSHPDTTVANIARSVLALPIDRSSDGTYHLGHVGFSYRELEKRFVETGFSIEKRFFSPMPILCSLLNSQVFYSLSVRSGGKGPASTLSSAESSSIGLSPARTAGSGRLAK